MKQPSSNLNFSAHSICTYQRSPTRNPTLSTPTTHYCLSHLQAPTFRIHINKSIHQQLILIYTTQYPIYQAMHYSPSSTILQGRTSGQQGNEGILINLDSIPSHFPKNLQRTISTTRTHKPIKHRII
ncbi:hypothetical protein V8G54_031346 [Vigna mungo]|uniref:Uncharacterized protein n=1 Tax=Vigna mungo TaxID=3915 RepID=A0AAQ3MYU6_VIGMU